MKRRVALGLVFLLMISVMACGAHSKETAGNTEPGASAAGGSEQHESGKQESGQLLSATDLMPEIVPCDLTDEKLPVGGEYAVAPTEFALQLFQNSLQAEESADTNIMISPVSVLYALAMTANGAKGDTLAQMEAAFGMTVPQLNTYLQAYKRALQENEACKLSIANSIWFTDDERLTVNRGFLQNNADYYGASIYKAPFDEETLEDINNWVADNTDGMIKDILNEIPKEAVMYLINAMAFDAEWEEIYRDYQVGSGSFTTESGEVREAEMLYSKEHYYLEDENATGFVKHYAGSEYAFVALLPNEGMSVKDYAATLTGEDLSNMLANPQRITTYATMPKFESEYSVEMSDILMEMGMTDAFDDAKADFSDLGTSTAGNIFINRVIHKTFITVDERGTKAGAATVVEMTDESMIIEETRTVILDRPFVYMIIDCEANLPLFIGTLMDVE